MKVSIEKRLYRIQYIDNTYQLVEWWVHELEMIYKDMNAELKFSMIDGSIFKLTDIRAIVWLKPETEPEENEEPNKTVVTEEGAYDQELYDLLVQNGIDLGNVIGEKEGN